MPGVDVVDLRRRLIVGLGNPGTAYAHNRHNIGFMVVDRLVADYKLAIMPGPVDAAVARGMLADTAVIAVKPLAYMNRSGGPTSEILHDLGIQCEEMVVIHDDIDLAYERIKIKEKGGDGGHNGLRSLIDALGTDAFVRVRMGVGRPMATIGVVEYVLGDFDATQRIQLPTFLSRAIAAVETILCHGAREAMNRFNRQPKNHV